jgi:hypothetical protein
MLSIVLALLALFVGAAPRNAVALDPQVRDDAGFFSPSAIRQANDIIRQIKTVHNKDFMIETYPGIPPEMQGQYSDQNKDQFFQEWNTRRAQQLGVNGVYVLITKEPGHVEVGVGKETRQRAFTLADRDRVRDILLRAFRAKQFDQGLLSAVTAAKEAFDRNMAATGAGGGLSGSSAGGGASGGAGGGGLPDSGSARSLPGPQSNVPPANAPTNVPIRRSATSCGALGGCLPILLIVIGIIVVVSIFRRMRRGGGGYGGSGGGGPAPGAPYPPQGGYGYGPGYGGGGGGFGRGLLGGLLGGWLGGWAQDHWSRSGTAQGAPLPPADSGGFNEPASPTFPSDQGHGFESSGGDFGGPADAAGSSDFGGGGGGDFGGGGDSSSSSGGDF